VAPASRRRFLVHAKIKFVGETLATQVELLEHGCIGAILDLIMARPSATIEILRCFPRTGLADDRIREPGEMGRYEQEKIV
jgi:hypothetical protein